MNLSDHEKQLIATIDEQVKLLREKDANDLTIISTLIGFIPEVRCIMDTIEEKELQLYLFSYKHFFYYAAIVEKAKEAL